MDQHNLKILLRILKVPNSNSLVQPISTKQIERWYNCKFMPEITYYYGRLQLLEPTYQVGGAVPQFEEYDIEDVSYLFKIDGLDAHRVEVSDDQLQESDDRVNIYFLTQLTGRLSKNLNCIHLIVFPGDRLGLVNGFTKKFRCVGIRQRDLIEVYSGPREGEILMKALILFCRKYRDKLQIDTLELNDESTFPCTSTDGNIEAINLLISNPLTGKLPYYMKFGFLPREYYVLEQIRSNHAKMQRLLWDQSIIEKITKIVAGKIPDDIREIMVSNMGKPVTEVLFIISRHNCKFYGCFYIDLYRKLKLYEFKGDETAYVLHLY